KDVAALLVTHHADVNARNKDGETPLYYAAFSGHKDVAELWLTQHADVNARNKDGDTPLHEAANNDSKDVAELLLAEHADINARSNNGQTPLHWAAHGQHRDGGTVAGSPGRRQYQEQGWRRGCGGPDLRRRAGRGSRR